MQVKYKNKMVDSESFRVVMWHRDGASRVAEGWEDYQNLLQTGDWFERLCDAQPKPQKRKKAVKHANGS
jgi:hypothetical protein